MIDCSFVGHKNLGTHNDRIVSKASENGETVVVKKKFINEK